MLKELHIENFALIDKVHIEFEKGFNILTGETGAGKSILIDAVGLLLGNRASTEFIRTGCQKAVIQGVFMFNKEEAVIKDKLKELDIELEEDQTIILCREISDNGRSSCRINGRLVTLTTYQDIGTCLVEIHGQGSSQSLILPFKQAELLDRFGGKHLQKQRNNINKIYNQALQLEKEKERIQDSIKKGALEKEFIEYQLKEITGASLKDGEEEELEKELKLLSSSQDLIAASDEASSLLFSGEGISKSAYDLVSVVITKFKHLQGINSELDNTLNELTEIMYKLDDIAQFFKSYSQDFHFDPQRIQFIEDRLATINKLKRKYGSRVMDILKLHENLARELEEIENGESKLRDIEFKLQQKYKEYDVVAEQIYGMRREAAGVLEAKILQSLKELSMPHVRFSISINHTHNRGPYGKDIIEYMISPNPGEPLKPMGKIVSGGEIARIMLSFKSILAEVDSIPVMIFDEVDAGIGGTTLRNVAAKLKQTSIYCQVICVTHSAQIASLADHHYYIKKYIDNDKTFTNVIKLKQVEERTEELTRMLGATVKAREHAKELLNQI
ncbi:MAG: DNA repair protein RecN [Bacillota bacterium]